MKTITKEDFDNAVKQSWSTRTCILFQASKRQGVALYQDAVTEDPLYIGGMLRSVYDSRLAMDIMSVFDSNFLNRGDESKPELQELRASLPVTL